MKDNIMFKGIMPALVTPFEDNGNLKGKTVENLMKWHFSEGVNGFYICGSTGEGPALRKELRKEMAEVTVSAAKGKGVIIDHIGAPNILDALELTRHATDIGVDAISSLVPTYSFKYTEDEIIDYYQAISDNTDKPILVYATSMMSGLNVVHVLERVMKIPHVIGVKFTIRDYFELRKAKEVNGGNINLINGPDETLICGLSMGADGGIGTTYNIMPGWFVELYKAFTEGDIKKAQEYQFKINHVIDTLIRYSGNGAIKATKEALNLMGYDCGSAVFPAKKYSTEVSKALKSELEAQGICF
jgi:N-acetylneuraminate lyase